MAQFMKWSAAVMVALCAVAAPISVMAQSTSSCGAILASGVYNTYSYRSSDAAASFAKSKACQDFSSYSYSQYLQDSSSSSAESTSQGFNAAATLVIKSFSFGGSGGSSSSKNVLSEANFNQAKTALASYRASACSSSVTNSQNAKDLEVLSSTIEPLAYEGYMRCLQMDNKGLKIGASYGVGANSVNVNMFYTQVAAGSKAFILDVVVFPAGNASCQLIAPPRPGFSSLAIAPNKTAAGTIANSSDSRRLLQQTNNPFQVELVALAYYSVRCAVTGAPLAGGRDVVEVSIFTSVAEAFTVQLYTKPPPTAAVVQLETRVAALEARLAAQESKTVFDVKRLCVGDVCLQPTAFGGDADDGEGRLFVVSKSGNTPTVMISTRKSDPTWEPFTVYINRDGAHPVFYVNKYKGFGVWPPEGSNMGANSLTVGQMCAGNVCLRTKNGNNDIVEIAHNSGRVAGSISLQGSETVFDFKRLCVGDVCLQPTAFGGDADDGKGRLYFVGKSGNTPTAMISTSKSDDPKIFVLYFKRDGSAPILYAENAYGGGLWGTWSPTPFVSRSWFTEVCTGNVCMAPSNRSNDIVEFIHLNPAGNRDGRTAVSIALNNENDIMRIYPQRDGFGGRFWWWNQQERSGLA